MPTSERPRRRRSVWNTAPGTEPEDEALLAEWRRLHPTQPWKGQDGKGGFVGWANRLDERVAHRGFLMSPRSEAIPLTPDEVWLEAFQLLKNWRVLTAVIAGVIVALILAPVLIVAVIAPLFANAAARVRKRKRAAMRAKLDHDR